MVRHLIAALMLLLPMPVRAQRVALRGQITDESGAAVPGATIELSGNSRKITTKSSIDGSYGFTDLPAGRYVLRATAPQLALRAPIALRLATAPQTVDLVLYVAAQKEELTVQEDTKPALNTEAAGNANAVVIQGKDLAALADNPDDLLADLQALAGPAAGPNGGSIYIDGFSGGQLPSKESIREVRINQNPFSPEFDRLGFGRIEIFTKPGTNKFHADLGYNFANEFWNSRNPYAEQKAPFRLHEFRESVSGPLGKRASFNLNFVREWVDNGNAVNTVVLDPTTLAVTSYTATPVSELRRTGATPRVDFQLSTNHTLSVRYSYTRDIVRDAGTGGFNLPSRGYQNDFLTHTLQLTETAVLSSRVVNETRFQYFRPSVVSQANSAGYALQVLGSFNGGGNPIGRSTDLQHNFEGQNNTSVLHGQHMIRFGFRIRGTTETNNSPQNYGGTYTFSGLLAPQLDANFRPVLDPSGQPIFVNITSIESYQRTLYFQRAGLAPAAIRQLGGGASQFSINAGVPVIEGSQTDIGLFAGDDCRLRPNLTVSMGLRYEAQTNLHDHAALAPRVGFAWAFGGGPNGSRPKNVVRMGFGLFYDRFALANVLTSMRYDGTLQQQYFVANPDFFPAVPPVGSLPGPLPSSTLQLISPSMRAQQLVQSAASFERQLPHDTTIAVTYANSHGLHMLRSRNINSPLPGTYDPDDPSSGVYPLGKRGLAVLMESSGLYNQNQLIFNVNSKLNKKISLAGSYAYGRALGNTDGLGTFPANQYSMAGEYGPAAIDLRHRVSLSGTVTSKWGVQFNPLCTLNTGPPYDITAGRDIYGSTLFNARPGIATDASKPGVVNTPYGLLDPNPDPGQPLVPRNYGRGPGQVMINLRVSRTFTFGSRERHAPAPVSPGGSSTGQSSASRGEPGSPFSVASAGGGAAASRRYSLVVSMQARNLINHNNPGPIIGNITSPLFGQANQPAGSGNAIFSENANNRRLELQIRFTF